MEEKKNYPFEFSVVMAVYNVEPFLQEAVESLIAQDFGFEKIQLIMVDDGSTDGSGAICDEYAAQYPENVLVIHKENGGVSSARNEGLKHIQGRYVNFMDSDDKLSANTMSAIFSFFSVHKGETDVVALPIVYFDGEEGEHPLNKAKFQKGSRIIDLYQEYTLVHYSAASAFIDSNALKMVRFKDGLAYAEDTNFLLHILVNKITLGVESNAAYLYRIRTTGELSAIQKSGKGKNYYLPFVYAYLDSLQYCETVCGYIPKFVQYTILRDIHWRFRQNLIPDGLLSDSEITEYRQCLQDILRYIDDDIIIKQGQIWPEYKCYMLSQKYGCPPDLHIRTNDIVTHFNNTVLSMVSQNSCSIELLHVKNNILFIEGYMKALGITANESLEVFLKIQDRQILCEPIERPNLDLYVFDDFVCRGVAFKGQLELDPTVNQYQLQLVLRCRGIDIIKSDLQFGKFAPLSRVYQNAYYFSENWAITTTHNSIYITRCGRLGHICHEFHFLREIWRKNKLGGRKAVFARVCTYIIRQLKRKEIWLICDKANRADDNGEAFFTYLQRQKPTHVKPYFLISKESSDFERLSKIGTVLPYMGWKHKLLYLSANYIISAYSHNEINNPFIGYDHAYRDLMQKCKYIFIQHGIIHNDVSKGLNRYAKNITGFVTSALREQQYIINTPSYGYSSKDIWLTGLPRHDRLYRAEQREIVLMPTWRSHLMGQYHPKDSSWDLNTGFQESSYYQFYYALLHNERLLTKAKELDYKINFVPHPVLFPYIDLFSVPKAVNLQGTDVTYRDMFARNKLLITDFSSVAFDFAYLRKPVIYCQFDADNFFNGGHDYKRGYFDYERDGFGEVEYDLESTVDRIIEYMENDCKLKDKYRERIDKFFAFNDQNNCQRVYEEIIKLDKQD